VKKFILISILLFYGCGYRPSSSYTPKTLGDRVYIEVEVSLSDPENSVLIRDTITKAIYTRLKSVTTTRKRAKSSIFVKYKDIKFSPLEYDRNGYVVHYKADVILDFLYKKGDREVKKSLVGKYDFPIRPSAIISTSLRFKAIEEGSKKALDKFIAYLGTLGLRDEKL